MDWYAALLIVTHLATLIIGVLIGRWLVVRNLRVREYDGHLGIERRPHDN